MRFIPFFVFFASIAYAELPHNLWTPPFYDGVAAEVEKTQITYDDIRREMAPLSPKIREQSKDQADYDAKMAALAKDTLNSLVDQSLILNDFFTKRQDAIVKMLPDTKSKKDLANDVTVILNSKDVDEEYNRILRDDFRNKPSDLIAYITQNGLTIPIFRKRLDNKFLVNSLMEDFRKNLPHVTPDQIAAYYNAHLDKYSKSGSVKLSAITLKPLADEPQNVLLQTAREIKAKANKGEDFSKLISEYNQEGSGDWGWLNTTDLDAEVAAALKDMMPGQLTEPIKIQGPKVIIIRLDDRHNEGVAPLSEVSESIQKELFETQARTAYEKWMAELRKKYYVKVNE